MTIPQPLFFTLPQLTERLPAPRTHPQAEQGERRSVAWCREHLPSLLGNEASVEAFLAKKCELIATHVYPDVATDRLDLIHDWMTYFAAVDDLLDDVRPADRTTASMPAILDPLLSALHSGVQPDDSPAYIHEMLDLIARLDKDLTREQKQRLVAAVEEYANGCADEDQLRVAGAITDFDTYMAAHVAVSHGSVVVLLLEYGLNIDVSAHLADPTELREAKDAAIRHVLLVNDLFSYRKEHFTGEVSDNAITLFTKHYGLDFQEAVQHLCDLILQTEREFYAFHDQVRATPTGHDPVVRTFLHGLEMLCSGYVRYSYVTPRYNGVDHNWNGVTSGTVTLLPDPTVYTAADSNDHPPRTR
ncbi:hypothetical protein [Streptomyces sp. NBC_00212]|uniref:terpene synthase family protein n=1 Tax=Streptomyces sp. NBC_00212 TaxID=2975684 RepID=UPI0032503FAA